MCAARLRSFFITTNGLETNWDGDEVAKFLDDTPPEYWAYCEEIGTKSGLHHNHMLLYYKNPRALTSIQRAFPHSNVQATLRTEGGADYIMRRGKYADKQGELIMNEEQGTPPKQGKRNDLVPIIEMVEQGTPYHEIANTFPQQAIMYGKGIKTWQMDRIYPRDEKPEVIWLHGASETGKSRTAAELAGLNPYWKNTKHQWWDKYIGNDTVILDELRPDEAFSFHDLLTLFDRYPLDVQYKGGVMNFNSPRIIVTSPHPPRGLYSIP